MCSIKVTQQKYSHSHSPNNGQVIDWSLEVLLKCQVLFVMDTESKGRSFPKNNLHQHDQTNPS